ncbi:hypothetical protein SAMN04488514_10697 [Kriegella aquimaris]|uniref:Uncharacterized protein n=1 Tax=Kriegella aquimaris TaxID=192904 RepID=A0A1G9RDV1_9FLAO|nr:hypothetical protein SAMN04488514_10697 [Kriegella aquimaris]
MNTLSVILLYYVSASGLILLMHRYYRHAFISLAVIIFYLAIVGCSGNSFEYGLFFCFKWILPLYAISMVCYAALSDSDTNNIPKKYQAKFQLRNGVISFISLNIRVKAKLEISK